MIGRRLVLAALLVAGCSRAAPSLASLPLQAPTPVPTIATSISATPSVSLSAAAPSQLAYPVYFAVEGGLTHPSQVRLGGTLKLSFRLRNVGTRAGSPWLIVTGLLDGAPLGACTPHCVQIKGPARLAYLRFPSVAPGTSVSYSLSFQPRRLGQLQYTLVVSGRPDPVLADADAQFDLVTAVSR